MYESNQSRCGEIDEEANSVEEDVLIMEGRSGGGFLLKGLNNAIRATSITTL